MSEKSLQMTRKQADTRKREGEGEKKRDGMTRMRRG